MTHFYMKAAKSVLDGSNRNVRSDVKNLNVSIDESKNTTAES